MLCVLYIDENKTTESKQLKCGEFITETITLGPFLGFNQDFLVKTTYLGRKQINECIFMDELNF